MGFAINTNNDALNTYRNLNAVQTSLSKSLEKLSSGLRINQAGDDAAGLTISTQLASQISGLTQASRNAQDGTSLVQTADGALTQAQSILGRLRDLAVQAGNDSNSGSARTAITLEATSLTAELARIGKSVNFNGQNLLDGTTPTFKFQVGADGNAQSQISVDLSTANLTAVSTALSTSTAGGYKVTAATIRTKITGTINITDTQAGGNADKTTLILGAPTYQTGTTAADYAIDASNAANLLNTTSAFSAKFTASVDSATNDLLIVAKDGGTVLATDNAGSPAALGSAVSGTTGTIKFDSATNAQQALLAIDQQISVVSSARANIGAIENRFNNVVSTISTSVTNLTAAKSRITDVDMAQEMVNYTRANVLAQAGTAMLAQANSLPQLALKLLS